MYKNSLFNENSFEATNLPSNVETEQKEGEQRGMYCTTIYKENAVRLLQKQSEVADGSNFILKPQYTPTISKKLSEDVDSQSGYHKDSKLH